jgi:hypothetical protein
LIASGSWMQLWFVLVVSQHFNFDFKGFTDHFYIWVTVCSLAKRHAHVARLLGVNLKTNPASSWALGFY